MPMPVPTRQQPQQFIPQNPSNNPISEIMSFAQNGGNLEQELRRRMSQNPEQAKRFNEFVQQNQNRNPWDLFYELAAQRGINPSQFGLPPRR